MTKSLLFSLALLLLISACSTKERADLLITNARIYTADSSFSTAQAFAVKDGKFIAVGTTADLTARFRADSTADLAGQPVYPGFFDPHSHFLGLGQMLDQADLVGAKSYDEVLARLKTYQQQHPDNEWLIGRGWDQNDWPKTDSPVGGFPTNASLNAAFPNTPVLLTRVDGHALLVNEKALKLAKITAGSRLDGGEVVLNPAKQPTGVLVDNAMNLIKRVVPQPDTADKTRMLLAAQKLCFSLGLTSVSDAGLNRDDIDLVEKLQKDSKLKIRDYVMISLGLSNLDYYLKRGPYQTDRLTVNAFKLYADGALGSRGACLRKPYADRPETSGFLLLAPAELERILTQLAGSKFQANK